MNGIKILTGDCREVLKTLPDNSVHCCVTSPPYWNLRDYGVDGQIGLEQTPDEYVTEMLEVFREVRRVLREDGTCWVNLGDSYNGIGGPGKQNGGPIGATAATAIEGTKGRRIYGLKPKDLVGIPWRVAFALQADGWYLRQDIIWHKPAPMPESVTDRCTKAHEYIFLLTKSARYYFDAVAIAEKSVTDPHNSGYVNGEQYAVGPMSRGGHSQREDPDRVWAASGTRNKRSVWTVNTQPFKGWAKTDHWVRVEEGGDCDDMRRIMSKGCPVHDCRLPQGGERASDSPNRSPGTGGCLAPTQSVVLSSSSTHRDEPSLDCSSDSLSQGNLPSASRRNNRIRKTDPDLVTTQPCTPCDQTADDTERTQETRGSSAQRLGNCESSTSEDESVDSQGNRTRNDNADNYSEQGLSVASRKSLQVDGCTCQFYRKTTKNTTHFATFPPDLIRPCILAGTSEEGVCAACGAPWARVMERTSQKTYEYKQVGIPGESANRGQRTESCGASQFKPTGWQPSCKCNATISRPIVLDPFGGSGTTAQVARECGCEAILIELNPEYVKLAKKRNKQEVLL